MCSMLCLSGVKQTLQDLWSSTWTMTTFPVFSRQQCSYLMLVLPTIFQCCLRCQYYCN